jgi:hypothetical protein
MNARVLLELLTTETLGWRMPESRVEHITGIGGDYLGAPSKVAMREVDLDGRKFLIQVISL